MKVIFILSNVTYVSIQFLSYLLYKRDYEVSNKNGKSNEIVSYFHIKLYYGFVWQLKTISVGFSFQIGIPDCEIDFEEIVLNRLNVLAVLKTY